MENPLLLNIAVKIHCAKLITGTRASPSEAINEARELVKAFLMHEPPPPQLRLVEEEELF